MSPTASASGTDEAVRAGFARRAEALHAHGASDDALRLLTAGVRRHPADVTARLVLSRVCADTGRADEARDWLESALRADPECPAARNGLAALGLVETADAPPAPHVHAPAQGSVPTVSAPAPEPGEADDAFPAPPLPAEPVARRQTPSAPVPAFAFPVREEEEDAEIEEISAPHIATATLAEIYLQQGLKEQAALIFRQLLEQHPGDDSLRRRLQEIEGTGTT